MKHEVLAVTMTLIAGLSTGIGGLITYFSKKPNSSASALAFRLV